MGLMSEVSRQLRHPLLGSFCILFNQLDLTSLILFNLELSITLADDPSIVEQPTWSNIVEERHPADFALTDARSIIAELIDTAIIETIWDAKRFYFVLRVFLAWQIILFHEN